MKTTLSLVILIVCSSFTYGAELFVDQRHPRADDKPNGSPGGNPGTEALPFKTIQPAVDAAKPGDKIWIKQGGYDGFVLITTSGTRGKPITLGAWKEDHVQIGFVPRPLPVEGEWKPVEGTKSFQIKLKENVPQDFIVVLNDKALITWNQDTPPKDEKVYWASYRKSDRTLMLNSAGKNPSTLGKFEYGRRLRESNAAFFEVNQADYWIIRKLEFSYCTEALRFCGASNCILEDCFFTRCYSVGVFMAACRNQIIRRCNFYRSGGAVGGCGVGIGHIIEDNLVVECGLQPEDDLFASIVPNYVAEGNCPFKFKGNMLGLQFRHNTLSDNLASGWWADCPGIEGSRLVGNAFWDNGSAIYNEDKAHDTITQGNVFYRNSISSSVSTRWNVIENLFYEGGVDWGNLDLNPICDGYMILRNNAFINPPQGYLADVTGGRQTLNESFRNCMVDHNRVWAKPDAVLIHDTLAGKKYKTMDEIRKELHWEFHGEALHYEQDKTTVESVAKAMGGSIVTYRVPWGKHGAEARPMLANSDIRGHWPASVESTDPSCVPCYFWRVADGDYNADTLWGCGADSNLYHQGWQCAGYSEIHGCRWYCEADGKFPKNIEERAPGLKGQLSVWCWKMMFTAGDFWYVFEGVDPSKMLPQGTGIWTPYLAAAPGAKITVSLRIRGKGLVSDDKGSPSVWMQFTNATGQHRQRVFVIGKDDQGKVHQPELLKGSYDWKEIKETITAPDDAVRMALFVGMRPCKGQVNYDDINITTASEASNVAAEILPPRLQLERFKETVLIDISKQANRKLADDADNDGKGGWTDQGSGADMRELKTGDRRMGGVMFRILPPEANSVIVLKSENRPKGDLPEKVTITVGKKLDALFFLHSAAWCPSGNDEGFHYVIHYADGKDITLKATGNNLVDWIKDPAARFPLEEDTVTTVVETVKNTQFKQGSLYRMEWSAPLDRRGVEIKSIDFCTSEKKAPVPILLGITGVVIWN